MTRPSPPLTSSKGTSSSDAFISTCIPGRARTIGSASNQLLDGKKGKQLPEAALVCRTFSGGKPGEPGLIGIPREVTTFFHRVRPLDALDLPRPAAVGPAGGDLESDFVEAPSQMLEEWMHDPKVLATFARNYQTNEPIPAELVARANRADAFGRGLWARFQLVYTSVSFDLHNMPPQEANIETVFPQNIKRFVPFKPLEGDNQIASFTHLTSYSSAYHIPLGQGDRRGLLQPIQSP